MSRLQLRYTLFGKTAESQQQTITVIPKVMIEEQGASHSRTLVVWYLRIEDGTCHEEHSHRVVVALQESRVKGGIAVLVDPRMVGSAVEQQLHGVRAAVEGGHHEQGVAIRAGEVDGKAGIEVRRELAGAALARDIEDAQGESQDVVVHTGHAVTVPSGDDSPVTRA